MMTSRGTLHKSKLQDFKAWCDALSIAYREGKGYYQALQVLTAEAGWQVIFIRNDMPEHFTVAGKLMPIVLRYLLSTPR